MLDDGSSGPQRDLWALPSDDLSPGAAVFLDMARDLQAGLGDAPGAWIEAEDEELPEPCAPAGSPDPSRGLRLVGSPDGEGAPAPPEWEGDVGARIFLEMAEMAGTVRPMTPDEGAVEPAIPDWLWSAGEEGIPAAELLLGTIEQAIRHVNQSEHIRGEEVRGLLLDLFGDFAVRRPWKDEERPEAQRVQRLTDQPRTEG
jgi:hypothetical protein